MRMEVVDLDHIASMSFDSIFYFILTFLLHIPREYYYFYFVQMCLCISCCCSCRQFLKKNQKSNSSNILSMTLLKKNY